jgi:V8-like Glu-specific endopeptidase
VSVVPLLRFCSSPLETETKKMRNLLAAAMAALSIGACAAEPDLSRYEDLGDVTAWSPDAPIRKSADVVADGADEGALIAQDLEQEMFVQVRSPDVWKGLERRARRRGVKDEGTLLGLDGPTPEQEESVADFLIEAGDEANVIRKIAGEENRISLSSWTTFHPLEAIGQLQLNYNDGFSHRCSATLVGEREVLTAAHCIVRQDSRGRLLFPNSSTFWAGRNGDDHPYAAIGSTIWYDNAWLQNNCLGQGRRITDACLSGDIALVETSAIFAWDGSDRNGMKNTIAKWRNGYEIWTSGNKSKAPIGYPQTPPPGGATDVMYGDFSDACRAVGLSDLSDLFGDSYRRLHSDCDVTPGMSGGALMFFENGGSTSGVISTGGNRAGFRLITRSWQDFITGMRGNN